MLGLLGVLLGFVGVAIFLCTFLKKCKGLHWMDSEKRMGIALYGLPAGIYGKILFLMFLVYHFDMNVVGISLFFMGMAFLSTNIGRSIPLPSVCRLLSDDPEALPWSHIIVAFFEPNSFYVVFIAILGFQLVRNEHMPYSIFNSASIYVSLGAMAAALLMGIVMRRMLENVSSAEEIRKNISRTFLAIVSAHALAIIGLAMSIITLLPYME